jgi:hypothetical protein
MDRQTTGTTPSRSASGAVSDATLSEPGTGTKSLMRRFLPLVLVAVVLGAGAALLYPAYASVEWDLEPRDAWLLMLLLGLVAGGYAWGRWKALAFVGAIPCLAPALLLDAAWLTGVWDRSDEYEPLPSTPFVLVFGVPSLPAWWRSASPYGRQFSPRAVRAPAGPPAALPNGRSANDPGPTPRPHRSLCLDAAAHAVPLI